MTNNWTIELGSTLVVCATVLGQLSHHIFAGCFHMALCEKYYTERLRLEYAYGGIHCA